MNEKFTYEEGMLELEKLVSQLEAGEMTLEDSFKSYERAVELKNALEKLLDEGDERIRVLTENGEEDMKGEELE